MHHQCLLSAYCAHTGHSLALCVSHYQTLCFLTWRPVSVTPGHRIPTAMGLSFLKGSPSSLPLLKATSPSPAQIRCPRLCLCTSPPSPRSLPFTGDYLQGQTSSWRPRPRGGSGSCRGYSESQGPQEGGRPERWPRACRVGLPGLDHGPGPRPRPPAERREGPGPRAEWGASRQSGAAGVPPSPTDDHGARVAVRLDS